jgi:hypothetical protein
VRGTEILLEVDRFTDQDLMGGTDSLVEEGFFFSGELVGVLAVVRSYILAGPLRTPLDHLTQVRRIFLRCCFWRVGAW